MGRRRFAKPGASGPVVSLHGAVVVEELDLHGETTDSAAQRVASFLERWSRQKPGAVVRIITGKGNRSQGPPVLRECVEKLLAGPLARFVDESTRDMGNGAFLIRMNRDVL